MALNRNFKREQTEIEAGIDDLYYFLLGEWEDSCRARSSTGENMVLEGMSFEDYRDFRANLRRKAEYLFLSQ